jgi:hypothetical protein
MATRGNSDFHNGRDYGPDKAAGGGLIGWLRRQFDKMLRIGGQPGPETILFTHALDDQLRNPPAERRQRRAAPPGAPFEVDPR